MRDNIDRKTRLAHMKSRAWIPGSRTLVLGFMCIFGSIYLFTPIFLFFTPIFKKNANVEKICVEKSNNFSIEKKLV